MFAALRDRAAPAGELLRRRFTTQPRTRNRGSEARVAGFSGKNQPAIAKRFSKHAPRCLPAWDGVAIAAKEVRIASPIGDDGRAERGGGFRAKNAGEFGAGMRFGRLFASARHFPSERTPDEGEHHRRAKGSSDPGNGPVTRRGDIAPQAGERAEFRQHAGRDGKGKLVQQAKRQRLDRLLLFSGQIRRESDATLRQYTG